MGTECPICGDSPIHDQTCPASCGSLEGILPSDVERGSRTFGFDWSNGFVAPFLGIDHETAKDALIAAEVSSDDNVVDLGCGDGRVCLAACTLGASSATGFDLDEDLIQKANEFADEMSIAGERRPNFVVKDLFTVDLNEYSVICMFLLPNTMDRLVPKLIAAAQVTNKCRRIISFGWKIPGLGEPAACCRGRADRDSTATERWFLYTQDQIEAERKIE